MPPWLPAPSTPAFVGERRLRAEDIDVIQRWVSAGAPEGDPDDLPKPPTWPDGWALGQPDVIATPPRAYILQPGHHDEYRNLVLPLSLPADRFVRAIEFRAGGAPVHHAVVRIDRMHMSRGLDGTDGQPGFDGMAAFDVQDPDGHFLGRAPGRGPIVAPEHLAWRLDRGADLIVELHLMPGTGPIAVQPSVGVFFTDATPTKAPVMIVMSSKTIDIAAGESTYKIADSYKLPVDADLLSL
jgi:hypothetical protein